MALKIHCISVFDGREGKTACGEPFFASRRSSVGTGEFQAEHRIGGLRAVWVSKFEPTPEHCYRCADVWSRGEV